MSPQINGLGPETPKYSSHSSKICPLGWTPINVTITLLVLPATPFFCPQMPALCLSFQFLRGHLHQSCKSCHISTQVFGFFCYLNIITIFKCFLAKFCCWKEHFRAGADPPLSGTKANATCKWSETVGWHFCLFSCVISLGVYLLWLTCWFRKSLLCDAWMLSIFIPF